MLKRTVLLLIALAFTALTSWAQQNPLVGTWKTNTAKSKSYLGAPSASRVVKYEASGTNGIRSTTDRVLSDGTRSHIEVTAYFDGSTAPYNGVQGRDAIRIKRIDANTYQVFYMKSGETVQINFWIVSQDGKTLTTVSTGVGSDNKVFSRIVVADKQ